MPRVPAPIPDPPRCVAGSRGATNCYLNGPGGPRLAGTVANADQFAQLHAFKIVQILRVDAARLRRGSCRPAQVVLIVDAGPLYAAFDADERHHAACRKLLESHPGPLLVPTLVVTEVAYLIGSRLGAEAETRFVGDIAVGLLVVQPVAASDWSRIAELVRTYRQMSLGTVDASTITLAERLR